MRTNLLLLTALLALSSCMPIPHDHIAASNTTVTLTRGGEPVVGAQLVRSVETQGKEATALAVQRAVTDSAGQARFPEVSERRYIIWMGTYTFRSIYLLDHEGWQLPVKRLGKVGHGRFSEFYEKPYEARKMKDLYLPLAIELDSVRY